jgi:hypothetical protein
MSVSSTKHELLEKLAGRAKAENMKDLSDFEIHRVFSPCVSPCVCMYAITEWRNSGGTLPSLYALAGIMEI